MTRFRTRRGTNRFRSTLIRLAVSLAMIWPLSLGSAAAQTTTPPPDAEPITPGHSFLVTGYGSVGFRVVRAADTTPNDFLAEVSPILLFQASDRMLFEAELEFELEEGVTETNLEYAQAIYSLTNNLKVGAGKLLLPFNTFTERHHPSWINKFVSPPPIYGGHGGAGPADPLLPVLTDVGAQLRANFDVGEYGFVSAAGYVTQGPRLEAASDEEEHPTADAHDELPEVIVGRNFEDNNRNKLVGGRVGVGVAPYVEVNFSVMRGAYDDRGDLMFSAYGAHVEGRYRDFEFHGEWIRTEQDVRAEEGHGIVTPFVRNGYYEQVGYRYGKWMPLVRWSEIFDGRFDGEVVSESGRQLALGLVHMRTPALLIKVEYLINREDITVDNDRFAVQWAFGF